MARKIHEEVRRAVLDAWYHGRMWRSPLTRSMYGQYGRRYEVVVDKDGVSVLVWGHRVARLCMAVHDARACGGTRKVILSDGGWASAMTRDALQDVVDALGIRVYFNKRGGEITCTRRCGGETVPVPFEGLVLYWD